MYHLAELFNDAAKPYHSDFWQYFEPIRQFMPTNCSADVEAVTAHIDNVFTSGPQSEIDSIKANFGLSNLTHLDDVAGACELFNSDPPSPDSS